MKKSPYFLLIFSTVFILFHPPINCDKKLLKIDSNNKKEEDSPSLVAKQQLTSKFTTMKPVVTTSNHDTGSDSPDIGSDSPDIDSNSPDIVLEDESSKDEVELENINQNDNIITAPEKNEEKPGESVNQIQSESFYREAMKIANRTRSGILPNQEMFKLLLEAAEMNHSGAREIIATTYLLNDGTQIGLNASFSEFSTLAYEGNPRGQWGLGFLHSTGLHPETKTSSAGLGHTYLTFAALGGDPLAEMTMGYRYWAGVGVEEDCENALVFYYRVANKVADQMMDRVRSGHGVLSSGPGVHRIRLIDGAETGIMGSSSSGSLFIDDDLLEYFHLMADKKNSSAQLGLGQLYYQGKHGVTQDHDKALYYFKKAANTPADPAEGPTTATALAYMGEIYMSGTETQSPEPALGLSYLRKAANLNSPIAQTGLGLAYLYGRGDLEVDLVKALQYFIRASEQGFADAQLHLGIMFLGNLGSQSDHRLALKYLTLASQQGNLLALFHLGSLHARGLGVPRSCPTATEFFKNVAERGKWTHMFTSAHSAYWAGNYNQAFIQYMFLAELGYEIAQSNVAFLLDDPKVAVTLVPEIERQARALIMFQRSANQGSVTSRLRVGDYHYYGIGTPQDFLAAIRHYRVAADTQRNSQAMFNLAYMHETGLGYSRDLHLAKRYYDMAAESSADAYVPTSMALTRLGFYFLIEGWNEPRYWNILYEWIMGIEPNGESKSNVASSQTVKQVFSEFLDGFGVFVPNGIDSDYYIMSLLLIGMLIMVINIRRQNRIRREHDSTRPNPSISNESENRQEPAAQNANPQIKINSTSASTFDLEVGDILQETKNGDKLAW